jgi:hypothetical protein
VPSIIRPKPLHAVTTAIHANNPVKQAIIGDPTSIVYDSDADGNESGAGTSERFMAWWPC